MSESSIKRGTNIDINAKPGLRDQVRDYLGDHRAEWYRPSSRWSTTKRTSLLAAGALLLTILAATYRQPVPAPQSSEAPSILAPETAAIFLYRANIFQEDPLPPIVRYLTSMPPQIPLGR